MCYDTHREGTAMAQQPQQEWSYQWSRFNFKPEESRFLFEEWIHPNRLEDFRGKRVLDAGCGYGHHLRLVAPLAREIVGVDLNTAPLAREKIKDLPSARIIEADVARADFPEPFDIVYCLGVIQHTDDPDATFENLFRLVKKGGRLILWAYSEEGNFLNRTLLEWSKKIALRWLPRSGLALVARAATCLLYPVVWSIYLLPPSKVLPFYEYFSNFRRLSFNQNFLNVFDKLNAPVTHFIPRRQIERWFGAGRFDAIHISRYKGVSWRCSGTKK